MKKMTIGDASTILAAWVIPTGTSHTLGVVWRDGRGPVQAAWRFERLGRQRGAKRLPVRETVEATIAEARREMAAVRDAAERSVAEIRARANLGPPEIVAATLHERRGPITVGQLWAWLASIPELMVYRGGARIDLATGEVEIPADEVAAQEAEAMEGLRAVGYTDPDRVYAGSDRLYIDGTGWIGDRVDVNRRAQVAAADWSDQVLARRDDRLLRTGWAGGPEDPEVLDFYGESSADEKRIERLRDRDTPLGRLAERLRDDIVAMDWGESALQGESEDWASDGPRLRQVFFEATLNAIAAEDREGFHLQAIAIIDLPDREGAAIILPRIPGGLPEAEIIKGVYRLYDVYAEARRIMFPFVDIDEHIGVYGLKPSGQTYYVAGRVEGTRLVRERLEGRRAHLVPRA